MEQFKQCAESGLEWNGDIQKSALFGIWMSSLKNLIDFESDETSRPTNGNSGDEEDDDETAAPNITSIMNDESVASRLETGNINSENPVIEGNIVQTIEFFANDAEIFADMDIGAMATVVADGDEFVGNDATVDEAVENILILTTDNDIDADAFGNLENVSVSPPPSLGISAKPSTSKGVFEILHEIRPVVMPKMKRKAVKKPSVISSSANIKKKTEALLDKQRKQIDKENRKAAREAKKEANKQRSVKRRMSDSFVVSETQTSDCRRTPEKPRKKKTKMSRRKIISTPTSSSAPATPTSPQLLPGKRHISVNSHARRPLFTSESDTE